MLLLVYWSCSLLLVGACCVADGWFLLVGCCLLSILCYSLFVVLCVLFVVCCPMACFVVFCSSLCVVCCLVVFVIC